MIDEQPSQDGSRDSGETPKLAQKLAPSVVPVHGNGRLLPGGQPGHKGSGGRPRNSYREFVQELLESDEARAQLETIIHDCNHPAFSSVYGKLLAYLQVLLSREKPGDGIIRVIKIDGLVDGLPGETA